MTGGRVGECGRASGCRAPTSWRSPAGSSAIDATNPSLVPGGAGERELAEVIAAWLDERGFDVRLVGADPARPSVLARRRGTGGGRTLLLAGHLDTVGGRARVTACRRPTRTRRRSPRPDPTATASSAAAPTTWRAGSPRR